MPEKIPYCIAGGGLAAASAAQAIRNRDAGGRIVIVTAEPEFPYHRPPLSKAFLKGDKEREDVFVQPEDWYGENRVEVWSGRRVELLDLKAREAVLDGGERLGFETLLIATGSRARIIRLRGDTLEGIFTLRTLADAETIREASMEASRAVVIGGGFIGMEVASAFASKGVETEIVHRADHLWERIMDAKLAGFFADTYKQHGVVIHLRDEPVRFDGEGRLQGVRTRGGKQIACELAVVGVGAELNVEFLKGTKIQVQNGILVNDRLETKERGIYAAGDVAAFPDPFFGKRVRIEHWDNALHQGKHAGANMAGADEPYRHMSYFFSDLFDLELQMVGDFDAWDRILVRGSLLDAAFAGLYVRGGKLTAALTVNRPWEEVEALRGLIEKGAAVQDPARWTDEMVRLEELG